MTMARSEHTATLLPNGKVLILGGVTNAIFADSADAYPPSAELYDPVAGTFAATGSMSRGRYGCTATLLPSGKVLILGGGEIEAYANAELYDPATAAFAQAGYMISARESHTATLLTNGKVLIADGWGDSGPLVSAELFDPMAGASTPTGTMSAARYGHVAVALTDGKVLVVGGTGPPVRSARRSTTRRPGASPRLPT
jgi:hypothetical protein